MLPANRPYFKLKIYMCATNINLIIIKKFKRRITHKTVSKELYQILGVAEDCKDDTLKLAFVNLAKRFHPDSKTVEADAVKFSEIENAYKEIRRIRNIQKDERSMPEMEEFNIKHTAPQHRHYLNFDVGIGTLSNRQRLHTIQKAQKAVENVTEHRLRRLQSEDNNTLVCMDKQKAHDIKTRYGMDRLVEDLIQEAMSRGEFNDLCGMGKPLNSTNIGNPYVDFVTHKLNQILINNGFTPEWIQLSKEIKEETEDLKKKLLKIRCSDIGELPLTSQDQVIWEDSLEKLKTVTKQINKKIDKYNLLVPMLQKQMLHIRLERLAEKTLSICPSKNIKQFANNNHKNAKENVSQNLLNFISKFFGKKID